jgi:hypothetical protein
MDKKKAFQKQILQSKITENTNILLNYQKKKDELIEKSKANTINTNIIGIDDGDSKIKINLLSEQKNLYEKENKIKKTKINELLINISQLEEEIKVSPTITKNKITKEETIYNDEIIRINNDTIENMNNNIETINVETINKETLKKEIELIKTNIEEQINIISTIQIQCLDSRKNILCNLKENKKIKLELNESINNLNVLNDTFIDKHNTLILDIENLKEFKKLLVDAEYNSNSNSDSDSASASASASASDYNTMKLKDYFTNYTIDHNLSLNDKLNLIDKLILNTTNQSLLVKKQTQNIETLNNKLVKDNLDSYNKINKDKVITYKDKFKIEKERKIELETILETKTNLYNNYQTLVMDKINEQFQNKIKELEQDTIKAETRLTIIKQRLELENENNKITLKTKIDNNKLDLQKLYLDISNNTNESKLLNTKIEKEKLIYSEMSIVETHIKKYKDSIDQSEKDLLSITL